MILVNADARAVLHGEHALCRERPEDPWHVHERFVGKLRQKALSALGFAQEVELARDTLCEFFYETNEIEAPPGRNMAVQLASDEEQNGHILIDNFADAGPLHLYNQSHPFM